MDKKKKTMWFRPSLISILRYILRSHNKIINGKKKKTMWFTPSFLNFYTQIYPQSRPGFECGLNFKGIKK